MKRGLARALIYGLPIILWMIVIFFYSAGERGRYENSLHLLQSTIIGTTPGWPYVLDHGMLITISMYQLNAAFRTIAHVFVYAVLTLLVVRMIQHGRTQLRPVSLVTATAMSAVYMAADEWKRWHEPHRHAKIIDLYLNLIGVVLVLGGTTVFFALKSWERRLAEPAAIVPVAPAVSKES